MLYTVRPLERIYKDWNKEEEVEEAEYKEYSIDYGTLVAKQVDDYYVVDHIISTRMEDYLSEDYQPGCRVQL